MEDVKPVFYVVGEVSPDGLMLPQPPDGSVNHGAVIVNPAEFDIQLECDLTPEQEAACAALLTGKADRLVTVQNCSGSVDSKLDGRTIQTAALAVSVYLTHEGRPVKPLRWVVHYDLGLVPDRATLAELTTQVESSLRDLEEPANANNGMCTKMRIVGRDGILHCLISFVVPNITCRQWYRDLLTTARNIGAERERLAGGAHAYAEEVYRLMENVGCGMEVGWTSTVAVSGVKKPIAGSDLHRQLLEGGWIARPADDARAKRKARRRK